MCLNEKTDGKTNTLTELEVVEMEVDIHIIRVYDIFDFRCSNCTSQSGGIFSCVFGRQVF